MDKKDIKKLRKSRGETQPEFARKLRVDHTTVSRWERGEQRPGLHSKKKLARLAKE